MFIGLCMYTSVDYYVLQWGMQWYFTLSTSSLTLKRIIKVVFNLMQKPWKQIMLRDSHIGRSSASHASPAACQKSTGPSWSLVWFANSYKIFFYKKACSISFKLHMALLVTPRSEIIHQSGAAIFSWFLCYSYVWLLLRTTALISLKKALD